MSIATKTPTILVVDDDEVLGQVLSRVLTREGRTILQATNAAQALQLTDEDAPSLALLDLCLPDTDGVELAKNLRSKHPGLPLILMTAYPLRLREHPELASQFDRVLTKPLNLQELRQAVDNALAAQPNETPNPVETPAPNIVPSFQKKRQASEPQRTVAETQERPTNVPVFPTKGKLFPKAAVVIVVLVLAVGAAAVWTGVVQVPGMPAAETTRDVKAEPPPKVSLAEDMENTLAVPKDTQNSLGMIKKDGKDNVFEAVEAKRPRQLTLGGSTALDTNSLVPVRIRFAPAEVIAIGDTPVEPGKTLPRELRSNDPVEKGQVIAVLESTDVGLKKSDLVDAVIQLRLDEDRLKDREELLKKGAIPLDQVNQLRRDVIADRNAYSKALNTLRAWRIPADDIKAVLDAAEAAYKNHGKHDLTLEENWGRVELRAPYNGTILERNIAPGVVINDNTQNLFTLGKVQRLAIQVNVPEDYLPDLWELPSDQRRWKIQTVGASSTEGIEESFDSISYLIDQSQHTAVIKGFINSPKELFRAGQFVTATISLSPPKNVVEVPATAIVTQGKQSIVFVQSKTDRSHYTMRRVKVTYRFDKTAYVAQELSEKDQALSEQDTQDGLLPFRPLEKGEKVLVSGALELKSALEDEQSKTNSK